MHTIEELFRNYGYFVLLIGLFLELIALPIPGEIMMSYCGFLVFKGDLNWMLSILVASIGVISGITVSYFLGMKLGYPFFKKHGKFVHLAPERLDKTSLWFNTFGKHVIFLTYYIPGIRHISGYIAGISRISFISFALNAYLGAIVWTTVFISIGKALGSKWDKFHSYTREFGIIGGIALLVVVVIYYIVKFYKVQILDWLIRLLNISANIFHTMGKIKFAMVAVFVVFLGLIACMIGLMQDFFAQEYTRFDDVVEYLVSSIYSSEWNSFMKIFAECTSYMAVSIVIVVSIFFILEKKFDRYLELKFLFTTVIGGEIFAKCLQFLFHREKPTAYLGLDLIRTSKFSYPSVEVMMAIIAYGFLMFLVIRHHDNIIYKIFTTIIFILVSIFSGQSVLYFGAQFPSDVLAGYIFGGLWLSLNIILLEIYRILPRVTNHKYI